MIVKLVLHTEYSTQVWVGLVNGTVSVFRRDHTVNWDLNTPHVVTLDTCPVTCLLPVSGALYARY